MSQSQRNRKKSRFIPALLIGGGAWYVMEYYTGPLIVGAQINPWSILPALFIAMSVASAGEDLFWWLGNVLDRQSAQTPEGHKGTANWVKSLDEIKHDLINEGWGPYWGTFHGDEVMSEIGSNSVVVGTTGSGKGVGMVQNNILTIRGSKVISDMKGENACITARTLKERGEDVYFLNIGGMFTDILGETAFYNPLCLIADNFWRAGGLQDISDDVHEIGKQLDPEPVETDDQNDNKYFRNGSRNLIGFALQMAIQIDGYMATLGDVAVMLNDKQSLLRHAKWACGRLEQSTDGETAQQPLKMPIEASPWIDRHDAEDVQNYINYFRGLATSVVDLLEDGDTRTSGPFLNGAQQAVERYNITTRAHKMTKRTTLRFSQLKEGDQPTTIFIMPDVSRMEAQKPVLELLQYCMFQELKRHENKHELVHYIGDEANNFKIKDLGSLLTWSRSYGLRFQLYIQNLPAFRALYGKDVLSVLISETEIKLFLPSQREPETIAQIEKILGERAYIATGRSGNKETQDYWIGGSDYREDNTPLLNGDQIRRTNKAILIIRRNRPLLVDLPPIAAISPFRDMIDINPFHGKPFRLPIKLTLKRDQLQPVRKIKTLLGRFLKPREQSLSNKKHRLAKLAQIAWGLSKMFNMWGIALVVAFALSPIGPHLRTSYQYHQHGINGPTTYIRCTYLGSRGFITPDFTPHCPILIFLDSRPYFSSNR